MTPFILAACAVTPVFLAGREGIDLSVGPLIGFVSVIMVKVLILDLGLSSPVVIVPAAILMGAAIGAINGGLAVYLRVQPIVTTLGTYLILTGLATWILPSPKGPVPGWLSGLSEGYSIVPILLVAVMWGAIKRLPLYGLIMTIGGEDRVGVVAVEREASAGLELGVAVDDPVGERAGAVHDRERAVALGAHLVTARGGVLGRDQEQVRGADQAVAELGVDRGADGDVVHPP